MGDFLVVYSTFAQTSYIFTFRFLAFSLILDKLQKTETETKKPHFCSFCPKTYVFVANKTLIFSDLWLYRVNYTTPPPLLTLAWWVSSLPKIFYFFYFLFFIFFVKYYDFANSAFLPNFENFWEYHIYFSFCIKFHNIYFWLFLWLLWRFM